MNQITRRRCRVWMSCNSFPSLRTEWSTLKLRHCNEEVIYVTSLRAEWSNLNLYNSFNSPILFLSNCLRLLRSYLPRNDDALKNVITNEAKHSKTSSLRTEWSNLKNSCFNFFYTVAPYDKDILRHCDEGSNLILFYNLALWKPAAQFIY